MKRWHVARSRHYLTEASLCRDISSKWDYCIKLAREERNKAKGY